MPVHGPTRKKSAQCPKFLVENHLIFYPETIYKYVTSVISSVPYFQAITHLAPTTACTRSSNSPDMEKVVPTTTCQLQPRMQSSPDFICLEIVHNLSILATYSYLATLSSVSSTFSTASTLAATRSRTSSCTQTS